MHIVVGSPIEVPHLTDPSPAEVEGHLRHYIVALESMFERRKAAAGHPRARLTVMCGSAAHRLGFMPCWP